jgi:hypothetical protein
MEISSGGTPGPRLAGELAALGNNVYGEVPGSGSTRALAEMFVGVGWRVRASSWTDYEVESEWACIELQQLKNEVILSGVVEPSRLDDLAAVFAGLDLRLAVELWNADGTEMIREIRG